MSTFIKQKNELFAFTVRIHYIRVHYQSEELIGIYSIFAQPQIYSQCSPVTYHIAM
jgi:hypothetical protein